MARRVWPTDAAESPAAFERALRQSERSRNPVARAEALRRHAQRYGPDLVEETARELGVNLRVPTGVPAKRMRRTSAELRAQVLELHGRAVLPLAIADSLNVADRRVREIIARAAGPSDVQQAA